MYNVYCILYIVKGFAAFSLTYCYTTGISYLGLVTEVSITTKFCLILTVILILASDYFLKQILRRNENFVVLIHTTTS